MTTGLVILLAVHLAATAAMTGLIWFVQVVHYPLFDLVGRAQFVGYEAAHTRLTAWVVGPFMAVEGVSALLILAMPGEDLGRLLPLVALGVLGVVHASTVFLQVPMHRALSLAYDRAHTRRLVATNWIRAAGWSVRSVLAAAMLVVANKP